MLLLSGQFLLFFLGRRIGFGLLPLVVFLLLFLLVFGLLWLLLVTERLINQSDNDNGWIRLIGGNLV